MCSWSCNRLADLCISGLVGRGGVSLVDLAGLVRRRSLTGLVILVFVTASVVLVLLVVSALLALLVRSVVLPLLVRCSHLPLSKHVCLAQHDDDQARQGHYYSEDVLGDRLVCFVLPSPWSSWSSRYGRSWSSCLTRRSCRLVRRRCLSALAFLMQRTCLFFSGLSQTARGRREASRSDHRTRLHLPTPNLRTPYGSPSTPPQTWPEASRGPRMLGDLCSNACNS